MGVSKNSGTPKWMVKILENPIKMDDLGGTLIFGNIHIVGWYHPLCTSIHNHKTPNWPQTSKTSPLPGLFLIWRSSHKQFYTKRYCGSPNGAIHEIFDQFSTHPISHLAVLDPEKKFEVYFPPIKYGIPKSSKPVSHWLSKSSNLKGQSQDFNWIILDPSKTWCRICISRGLP